MKKKAKTKLLLSPRSQCAEFEKNVPNYIRADLEPCTIQSSCNVPAQENCGNSSVINNLIRKGFRKATRGFTRRPMCCLTQPRHVSCALSSNSRNWLQPSSQPSKFSCLGTHVRKFRLQTHVSKLIVLPSYTRQPIRYSF